MLPRPASLAARLTLSSALVLPLILVFSAFSLDRAFYHSLLDAEQQTLQSQLYLMMGAAEPGTLKEDPELQLPEALAEPRFNRPLSGLSGVIVKPDGEKMWQSISHPTLDQPPEKILKQPFIPGGEHFVEVAIADNLYFSFSFDSVWEVKGEDNLYRFVVLHNQRYLKHALKSYREVLWLWIGGIAILFIAALFFITRWGLRPLNRLALELKKFQQGQNTSLEGQYPSEIAPVISNLNEVLDSEQAQRQRYKNTLSDLAHSLKTPLAIIRAELETQNDSQSSAIDEQISRMADIIQHQLQRATLKSTTSMRVKTPLAETVKRVTSALEKVYSDKAFTVEIAIDESLQFPGDESDALEIFGNLLENAFKYGQNQLHVNASQTPKELRVVIADNGPGIPEHLKKTLLNRGARADTSVQGQGIGLAIVVDMLSSYSAQLDIGDSPLGGAEFKLTFPKI